jgi:hypothetical protein
MSCKLKIGCWRLVAVQSMRTWKGGSNPHIYNQSSQESDSNQLFNPTFLFISRNQNTSVCHCPGVHKPGDMVIRHICTVHSLDEACSRRCILRQSSEKRGKVRLSLASESLIID